MMAGCMADQKKCFSKTSDCADEVILEGTAPAAAELREVELQKMRLQNMLLQKVSFYPPRGGSITGSVHPLVGLSVSQSVPIYFRSDLASYRFSLE